MLSTADFKHGIVNGSLSRKFRGFHSDPSVAGLVLEYITIHFHSEPLGPHLCRYELELGVQGVSGPH